MLPKQTALMIDVDGLSLLASDRQRLLHPAVCGVILFSRNYQSKSQLIQLTSAIRQLDPDLLIAVDHEGGRVQRFRDEFTLLPAMGTLGELYVKNPEKAVSEAFDVGFTLASELVECGVDFSFTPVLDRDYGVSSVIGDRSFHQQISIIVELAGAVCRGLNSAGMITVGKHFPGHGAVTADSHTDIPVDVRSFNDIQMDIQPFERLIEQGLDAIMPAHVIYSQLDEMPAGFSAYWLQKTLRQSLGFKGIIISDDIVMEGASIAGDYVQRVHSAMQAGCDFVLVCNKSEAVDEILLHCVNDEPPRRFLTLKAGKQYV